MHKQNLLIGVALCALAAASSAFAADVAATDAATATAANAAVEEVVVYGQGQARQTQSVTASAIAIVAPGTSPIKVVERLPGVNFQSADAFGSYEWSTRISIRGFSQNQLGFTLDGVPLGDMSYGNVNGLHISRAVISEDLGGVELAQGAGALDTASSSNLGGTLKFTSRNPSAQFGVFGAATGGSNNMYRGFARLETGDLPSGGRGYISYANQKTDKWKGHGIQKQQQLDAKFIQPVDRFTLTGFYDWSQRREDDYQDLSLEMINRLGYNWDNIGNNYALANTIANTAITSYLTTGHSGDPAFCVSDPGDGSNVYPAPQRCDDDAYFDAGGLRDDSLWSISGKGPITSYLNASVMGYGHTNKGQGTWFAPLNPSPNFGVPGATTSNSSISYRTTEYNIDRKGAVAGGDLTLGDHTIHVGAWYENNDFKQARRYYALDAAAPNRGVLDFQSGPYKTKWHYAFNTKTTQFSLEDSWRVIEGVKLTFGFKSLKVENKATFLDGYGPLVGSASIKAEDNFLPQVGATWKINDMGEVFGDYTENMRAFTAAATGSSVFNSSQTNFDLISSTLKPETSQTFEGGYRFHIQNIQGVVAAYHVKFDHRLLVTSVGAGVAGNAAVLSNVGSVTTNGVETAATWKVTPAISVSGSYAYNSTKYDSDVITASGPVRTGGKTEPDAPNHLVNLSLDFDQNGWFGTLSGHYVSERYITYTNDLKAPSYAIVDLTAGYRFGGQGWTKGLEIQANITNLFDKKYIATIGSNGFINSGDSQTLLAGAPRQGFVTVRKQF